MELGPTPISEKPYKFQNYSWSDLPSTGIQRQFYGLGWMKQHDLAVEAHEHTDLEFKWWRDMIAACQGGLPIILTYRDTRRTVIIEQILSYSPNTTANMYIRCWGFAYPLSWKAIRNVEVPQTEFLKEDDGTL